MPKTDVSGGVDEITSSNAEKVKKPSNTLANRFNIFWNAYPKKKSKGSAEKAWNQLKPTQELLEKMLKTIEKAKEAEQWQKDGGQFIPYPASWLRAKGWEDDYKESSGVECSFDADVFWEAAVKRSVSSG
ncbi:MAG: hypothetical protein A2Y15_05965 [Clostridiales bacterium GWF2_36_10]|nr:MAG: hypothetical protein A2Y15_05965 [Clostridiales bacterium GWF2_36_10]HAN21596.1 hypothetical protein [Clostridiales bacterium]